MGKNNKIIKVKGNEFYSAHNKEQIETYDYSVVHAYGNTYVVAHDYSEIEAYDNSLILACGNSKIIAHGNSRVESYENTTVYAYDNAIIRKIGENVTIIIKSKHVKVLDYTKVIDKKETLWEKIIKLLK